MTRHCPIFGLVLLSVQTTISWASRTKNAPNPVELPAPSKTVVHQLSRVSAVDFHAKSEADPKVGKTTKTVVHQKVAGNGYKPGSPLYNLQESKKDNQTAPIKKAAEPQNGTRQEKLYACVDHVLDEDKMKQTTHQEVMEGINTCIQKYDATPLEAWAIRERANQAYMKSHLWTVLVFAVAAPFILTLIAAFIYQRNKKDPAATRAGMGMTKDDFAYGVCQCFEVPTMSLLACFCFPVRWADTMRMASFMSFWVGVVLMIFLEVMQTFTAGISMLIAWGIVVHYRQQLRKAFDLEHGTLKSCCCDICGYCWIPCCMAVQEARQLEEAYAVGHPIRKA